MFPWEVDTPDETGESPSERFFREQRENMDRVRLAGKEEEYRRAMARTTAVSDAPMSQEDHRLDYMDEIDWRILRAKAMLAASNAERMADLGFPSRLVLEDTKAAVVLDAAAAAHGRWVGSNHFHHRRRPHVERQRHQLAGIPIDAYDAFFLPTTAAAHGLAGTAAQAIDAARYLQARYTGRELPKSREGDQNG